VPAGIVGIVASCSHSIETRCRMDESTTTGRRHSTAAMAVILLVVIGAGCDRAVAGRPIASAEAAIIATELADIVGKAGDRRRGPAQLQIACRSRGPSWQDAATSGNAAARYLWGLCNLVGASVDKDPALAISWFRLAAGQGLPEAQTQVGVCIELGLGAPANATEAVEWYRRAAARKNALAQYHLGRCHQECLGVACSDSEALRWYMAAAEQGLAMAQNAVGVMLEKGRGTASDPVSACDWYEKAAAQDDVDGLLNAAVACHARGIGVPCNIAQARELLRRAAVEGNKLANGYLEALRSASCS